MSALEKGNRFNGTSVARVATRRGNERATVGRGTGNVLIVDPGAARRWRILKAIEEIAGRMYEASTTSQALTILQEEPIDLVLVELRTPELGATSFCSEARSRAGTKFLQIFVVAEPDSLDSEVSAIEAGANEFWVGPLRDRALRARVESALRHKELVDSLDDSESVFFTLAKSVEDRDPDLGLHCQRLSIIAAATGVALDLQSPEVQTLYRGGYLHDIGKISIPDRILFKPGPLTGEEWETMKLHTVRGEKMCMGLRSLQPVLPIIRSHHERWDGLGYPDGLRGEEIPVLARILQLADIYDALTTARPYKAAYSPDEALAIILEETGKGWRDPHLVRVFVDLAPMFRDHSALDLSHLSLQALASAVESYRRENKVNWSGNDESGPIRLAG